jgi:hypothetical protein
MTAPSFRSARTTVISLSGTNQQQFQQPAGLADSDVLIALLDKGNNDAITKPTGFELIRQVYVSGSGELLELTAYYKPVLDASNEPANYTFSWSNSIEAGGILAAYSGCDTANPVNISTPNDGNTNPLTMLSVTTTRDECMILCVGADYEWRSKSLPSGTDLRATMLSDSSEVALRLWDFEQASAGASGSKTSTLGSASNWIGFTIALQPPAAGNPFQAAWAAQANQVIL